MALLANACSKWGETKEDLCFKNAVRIIAEQLIRQPKLKGFKPQNLAMLANACSKLGETTEDPCFKNAVKIIAEQLIRQPKLKGFEPQV